MSLTRHFHVFVDRSPIWKDERTSLNAGNQKLPRPPMKSAYSKAQEFDFLCQESAMKRSTISECFQHYAYLLDDAGAALQKDSQFRAVLDTLVSAANVPRSS